MFDSLPVVKVIVRLDTTVGHIYLGTDKAFIEQLMLTNMAKPLIASFLLFLFTGCSKAQTDNSIHIYIPIDYTGWVNLIFNDRASTIEPLTFQNGYVYLISKDPQAFRIKSDKFPSGKYDMHYYYYNTDTTIELSWLGYPKKNIFFEGTIGGKSKNQYRSSTYTHTFYVSKELLDEGSLSIDKLPKNKILQ